MPSFSLPTGSTPVAPSSVADVTLPDPANAGAAGARGAVVALLRLVPAGTTTTLNIVAPATGEARLVTLSSPVPGTSVSQLLVLAPLPFSIAAALAGLPGGVPIFYLAVEGTSLLPMDRDALMLGDPIASGATALHVGVLFQDRVTVSPRTWLEALGAVDSGWQTAAAPLLAALTAQPRSLRILDHTGRPAANVPFAIETTSGSIANAPVSTTDARGFLTVPATGPVVVQRRTALGLATVDDTRAGRIYSLYVPRGPGSIVTSEPDELTTFPLPASFSGGELQILDVAMFLGRSFRTGCRLEPMVDGVAALQRLARDLSMAAAAPGGGLPFGAALACHQPDFDFNLVHGDATTRLSALAQALINASADLRLMVNDVYHPRAATLVDITFASAVLLIQLSLVVAGLVLKFFPSVEVMPWTIGFLGVTTIVAVAAATALLTASTPELFLEQPGLSAFNAANALSAGGPRAVFSVYPARFSDNPLANTMFDPPDGSLRTRRLVTVLSPIAGIQDQFGSWHEKLLIVRLPLSAGGVEWAAYLGSIDVGPRWRDSPGHGGRARQPQDDRVRDASVVDPVHGVHARLTGPVLADLVTLWNERWNATPAVVTPGTTAPRAPLWSPAPPTTALDLGASGPGHIVAIGRTHFKDPPPFTYEDPARGTVTVTPTRPADPASDALIRPLGETSIHDTLLRAIGAARDYIYIEDAAFTPSESTDPSVSTIVSALVRAATSCARLVIVVPAPTDVAMGSDRRSALFARLRGVWGARGVFAAPLRRPFLPAAPAHTDQGRAVLTTALAAHGPSSSPITETVRLKPYGRVPPAFPAWLWVEGELMLATAGSRILNLDGEFAELTVQRGGPWGAKVRRHVAGAPATAAQLKGILVGSSVVIVDDMFVSVGSGSVSRRGLFHDGEMAAFAVPAGLRSAGSNPARELRCALWAEHLGLPPSFGAALLADPLAAFDLFARRREQGNRLVPHDSIDVFGRRIAIPTSPIGVLSTLASAFAALTDQTLFDFFQDPTGYGDPSVSPGT